MRYLSHVWDYSFKEWALLCYMHSRKITTNGYPNNQWTIKTLDDFLYKILCNVSDIMVCLSSLLGGAGFPHLTADLILSQWYQIGKKTLQHAGKWINDLFYSCCLLNIDSWTFMSCALAAILAHRCVDWVWPVCQSRMKRSRCCCRHQTIVTTPPLVQWSPRRPRHRTRSVPAPDLKHVH